MTTKNSPRCLVIGANGFVGSHLVDELAEAGFQVRAFDRFSQPEKYNPSALVQKFTGDVMNMTSVHEALEDVDYLIHSFSASTPFSSEDDPFTDISHTLLQNVRLFEQAVTAGIKKVVYLSSGGAIYGSVDDGIHSKELSVPLPVSPYGIAKLATEHYLEYFKRKFDLQYVVYRLTNPYGPRQILKNNQGVIPAFIEKIQKNEDVTIFGDGSSSRDYIYIRDATKMIVSSFSKTTPHTIFNIGSGYQTSINEILSKIQQLMGKQAAVNFVSPPTTFLSRASVSVERYIETFGQPLLTSLEKGLSATIANFPSSS